MFCNLEHAYDDRVVYPSTQERLPTTFRIGLGTSALCDTPSPRRGHIPSGSTPTADAGQGGGGQGIALESNERSS